MSLPQLIDFRNTSGFVSDPANAFAEAQSSSAGTADYPTTTAQGNNVGWEGSAASYGLVGRDRNSGIDARLAGCNQVGLTLNGDFRIDLPSAGTYNVSLAAGDATYARGLMTITFKDTTTVLATPVNNVSTSGAAEFYDATGVQRISASDWVTNNATQSLTFSTTIFRTNVAGGASGSAAVIAHLAVAAMALAPYVAKAIQVNADDVVSGLIQMSPTVGPSPLFTLSAWFNTQDPELFPVIFSASTFFAAEGLGEAYIAVGTDGSNGLLSQARDATFADSFILSSDDNGAILPNKWNHIFSSLDVNHAAGAKIAHQLINGINALDSALTIDSSPAFTITYSGGVILVGGLGGVQGFFRLADVQVWIGQAINPTASNLANFIDSNGKPVNPSVAASAFGTQTFLFTGDATTFPINQGTGGPFTIYGRDALGNTPIVTYTPGPSDPPVPQASFQGLLLALWRSAANAFVDPRLPTEMLITSQSDAKLPLESLVTMHADGTLTAEALEAALSDGNIPDESLITSRSDRALPNEFLFSPKSDGSVPIEERASASSDGGIPSEFLVRVIDDSSLADEFQLVARSDGNVPYESQTSPKSDGQLPNEFGITARSDGSVGDEFNLGIRSDGQVPNESQITSRSDGQLPAEFLRNTIVDGSVSLEFQAVARVDGNIPDEWSGTIAFIFDNSLPTEFKSSPKSDSSIALEFVRFSVNDLQVPLESLHLVISGANVASETAASPRSDAALTAEINATLSLDNKFTLEQLLKAIADETFSIEMLARTLPYDNSLLLEWKGALLTSAIDSGVPFEFTVHPVGVNPDYILSDRGRDRIITDQGRLRIITDRGRIRIIVRN